MTGGDERKCWFVTAAYGSRQFGTFTVQCATREQAIAHIQYGMGFCWGVVDDPKCIWRWSAIRVALVASAAIRV